MENKEVSVVHCRECCKRNKSADLSTTVYCRWLGIVMPKDGFCNYGQLDVDANEN